MLAWGVSREPGSRSSIRSAHILVTGNAVCSPTGVRARLNSEDSSFSIARATWAWAVGTDPGPERRACNAARSHFRPLCGDVNFPAQSVKNHHPSGSPEAVSVLSLSIRSFARLTPPVRTSIAASCPAASFDQGINACAFSVNTSASSCGNSLCDFVLEREYIRQLAVIAFRPYVEAVRRVDQLDRAGGRRAQLSKSANSIGAESGIFYSIATTDRHPIQRMCDGERWVMIAAKDRVGYLWRKHSQGENP